MPTKGTYGIAYSEDPERLLLGVVEQLMGVVLSRLALFSQAYVSEILGSILNVDFAISRKST